MAKYLGNALILKVESTPLTGTYATIGGSVEHTFSQSSESVDVSDKDSNRWGEILAAGGRSATLSMECWVSDNANFEIMRSAWQSDSIIYYQFEYGNAQLVIGKFHIESLEITAGRNTAQSASVSFTSSEPPIHGALTDFLLDSSEVNITDSNGQYIQGI